MDKFINLMYDFFAFAFPGSCIIIITDQISIIERIQNSLNVKEGWSTFLLLVFAGYIIGYLIKPIAGKMLILWIKYISLKMKRKPKLKEKLLSYLCKDNLSKQFVVIRERKPKNAQYIEFWDMHITMSHNLAFASLIFIVIHSINNQFNFDTFLSIVIALCAFLLFMNIAVKFSIWWCSDIKKSYDYLNKVG